MYLLSQAAIRHDLRPRTGRDLLNAFEELWRPPTLL